MKQLTIRGFNPQLEQSIRRLARREGISLNKAALRLLQRGAEMAEAAEGERLGAKLAKYAGTMSDDEARDLLDSIADTERIDADAWR